MKLDRNGSAPSIVQEDLSFCFHCGRTTGKLDRHEIFSGAFRTKSKADGLWVMLCHEKCHLGLMGKEAEEVRNLRRIAQVRAMSTYGWTVEEFIARYGKNYLER